MDVNYKNIRITNEQESGLTEIGKWLRAFRVSNNLSINDMAEKLCVSVPSLSAIENGKTQIPKEFIEKFGSAYRLTDKQKKELILLINKESTVGNCERVGSVIDNEDKILYKLLNLKEIYDEPNWWYDFKILSQRGWI